MTKPLVGAMTVLAEPGPMTTDPAIARDGERAETGGRFIQYWCQCHESLHPRFV